MAKTRPTKTLREEILANVLKATNFEKEAGKIRAAASKLAREIVSAQVPQAFLASCATVEAVIEKMPELQKHIPVKAQFYAPTVNVNNLFTALTAAGFDNTVTS